MKRIPPQEATGELKEIYKTILEQRGGVAEVYQIHSLNPQSMIDHLNMYMTIMFGKSPLKRVTREIIGTVVSQANQCEYCIAHHAEAVNNYWKNDERCSLLKSDFRKAGLSKVEETLSELAEIVTLNPSSSETSRLIDQLKTLGLDDRSILDAVLIISYFNYVNRMVLVSGIQLEKNQGKGYIMGQED